MPVGLSSVEQSGNNHVSLIFNLLYVRQFFQLKMVKSWLMKDHPCCLNDGNISRSTALKLSEVLRDSVNRANEQKLRQKKN